MHKLFPGKIYEFFFFFLHGRVGAGPCSRAPSSFGGGMLLPHGVCVWGGPWWLFATPPNPQPPPPGFGPLGRPPRTPRLCLHARLPAVYSPLLCVLGEGGGPWGPPHLFPCLSPSGLGGVGWRWGGVTGGLFLLVASPRAILQAGPPLPDTNSCHGGRIWDGITFWGGGRSAPPPSPRGCHCAKSLPGSSAPSSQGLWWLRGSALILGIRGVCPPPVSCAPPSPNSLLRYVSGLGGGGPGEAAMPWALSGGRGCSVPGRNPPPQ